MKIGELAKKTGVSIRSLRYYEEQGLLSPSRTDSGYREYHALAAHQVETIQFYLKLGLSTEQIASFLHCVLMNKEVFCQEILPVYRQKLAEINEQLELLTQLKSNLEERIQSIVSENLNPTEVRSR
ncbi:MerR family transcriptional regulator [Paenibacillus sp. P26]|nr:MerR family transcriptional regulator [Paenibacillus sp. P26]UUZ94300.1 MerR family transcriptional regulator [Paenibacillus sp. P25]